MTSFEALATACSKIQVCLEEVDHVIPHNEVVFQFRLRAVPC